MSDSKNQNNLSVAERAAAALDEQRAKDEAEREFWRKRNAEIQAKLEAERATREKKLHAAQAERAKQRAAESERQAKESARVAWIAAGGDPEQFELSWETLRAEMLKNAVLQTRPAAIFKSNEF